MASQRSKSLKPTRYIQYTLEFLLMMVFNIIIFILPWFVTWRLGRGLGWIAFYLLKKRKGTVESNIRRAFPDMSQDEQTDLAKGCYMHWGEGFISTLKLWMISRRKARSLVDAPGLDDYVLSNQELKEPVLYFTGHFGSWEMAGRYVGGIGMGGASIYRIQRNPLVNWFLTWIREFHHLKLINSWSGMSAFEEGMIKYSCLAVVGDQYKGKGGVQVDFFDLASSTPRGAAVLTYRAKPHLVVLICRQNRGRYRIDFEEVDYSIPESMTNEWVRDLTQDLTSKLEDEIRKTPEQYFWFHKRWRDLDREDAKREKAHADH